VYLLFLSQLAKVALSHLPLAARSLYEMANVSSKSSSSSSSSSPSPSPSLIWKLKKHHKRKRAEKKVPTLEEGLPSEAKHTRKEKFKCRKTEQLPDSNEEQKWRTTTVMRKERINVINVDVEDEVIVEKIETTTTNRRDGRKMESILIEADGTRTHIISESVYL
jgi:hypothetical protein